MSASAAVPLFIHLRLHSEYSIVDGMVRIDDAVDAAAADRMPALALTDLANVFGMVKFYKAARSRGVKPIIGCDVWITHESERDAPQRLLLLCQSRAGYLRLCDWLTRAHRANQHRGRAGAAARVVRRRHRRPDRAVGIRRRRSRPGAGAGQCGGGAAPRATALASAFPGRFYLEVQRAGHPDDEALTAATLRARERAGAAGRRDAPGAVRDARRIPRPRGARVHRRGPRARRPAAAEALHARAVFQDRRPRWRNCSPTCRRRWPTASRSRSAAT